MNTRNIQLNGSNLCNTECLDRNAILHPETCVNQILTTDNSISTLSDWVDGDDDGETHHGSFADYNNLKAWLDANFSSDSYTLPTASSVTKGGIKIGEYLTMDGDVLSVNKSSLDIPNATETSTVNSEGLVKLGNKTAFTSDITNFDTTIAGQIHDSWGYNGHVYVFPLRLDSNSRAGVAIPTSLFNNSPGITLPDWTFDWSKNVINVDTSSTATSGVETNYVLLGNKNNNTANGELGYDDNGNLSTDYGYPRFALVAGDNISFTRYNNNFISNANNFWGDTITELLISANVEAAQYTAGDGIDITDSTISQEIATSSTVGGIKIGYTETSNKRAVQLDPTTNQAFVELSTPVATWVSNGLSKHYFNVTETGYVPIMRIARAAGYTDGFKINQLFRLVSRHGTHFIGEFYIDFKNASGLTGVIMARDIVSDKKDNVDFLTKNDIYVVKGTPTEDEYDAGLTANDIAVVYFNVKKLVAETSSTERCVFIVDVIGCNDIDIANHKMVNNYTYYCTTNFGDDTVISSSDILSDLTGLTSWNFTTLPTA